MKATRARTYWDEASWPWEAVAIVVAVDVVGLALARFVGGWLIWGPTRAMEAGATDAFMSIAGNWPIAARMLLVAAFAMYFTGRGVPPRAFGIVRSGFRKRLGEFGRCLLVILPLAAALTMMSILFFRMGGYRELIHPPLHLGTSSQAWQWILVFVVALPPLEEFLYRGIVHPVLRRRFDPIAAAALGGVLFGVVHWLYGIDLVSLPAYALGGFALAWVYERTGSLLFPWMLHVATNLAAVWISSYPGLFEALRT